MCCVISFGEFELKVVYFWITLWWYWCFVLRDLSCCMFSLLLLVFKIYLWILNFADMVWASKMKHLMRSFVIYTAGKLELMLKLFWVILLKILLLELVLVISSWFWFRFVSSVIPPGGEELTGNEVETIINFKNALGIDDPDAASMHVEVLLYFLVECIWNNEYATGYLWSEIEKCFLTILSTGW